MFNQGLELVATIGYSWKPSLITIGAVRSRNLCPRERDAFGHDSVTSTSPLHIHILEKQTRMEYNYSRSMGSQNKGLGSHKLLSSQHGNSRINILLSLLLFLFFLHTGLEN